VSNSQARHRDGVETKRINEAVKNNPDKFPKDYMFELSEAEFADLRSKFSTTKFAKTRVRPKAFTEKGLYMIATILRSREAIDATFAIIETFSKIRELSRSVKELSVVQDKNDQKGMNGSVIKCAKRVLTPPFPDRALIFLGA